MLSRGLSERILDRECISSFIPPVLFRNKKEKKNSDGLCARPLHQGPPRTHHHHHRPNKATCLASGRLQARGGPDHHFPPSASAAPHAARVRVRPHLPICDASATMSLVAPAGWRRDGRVPLLRVHDPPGSRRAVVVPPRGPSPATSARLLRRCLVPSAGFYSVSEHSPPRADLDDASDSAARGDRRPLLLVWIE